MNYGLYLSASGVLTNLYRQDVFSNNLANVETTGFKPDIPSLKQRAPEQAENQLGYEFSDQLLDRLGGGVLAGVQSINFAPGTPRPTGRNLDIALAESDRFFAVQYAHPTTGETSVRLTRNGNFTRATDGTLVTQAGQPVLDASDQPIVLPETGDVHFSSSGEILVDGQAVAQLQVAQVADLSTLSKAGQNLFSFDGPDPRILDETPSLYPKSLEASGSDPIKQLMNMISATKAATGNANMMRYFDTLMDHAINTLGRVA